MSEPPHRVRGFPASNFPRNSPDSRANLSIRGFNFGAWLLSHLPGSSPLETGSQIFQKYDSSQKHRMSIQHNCTEYFQGANKRREDT
eukprot:1403286-Amphidinium_carterae.1